MTSYSGKSKQKGSPIFRHKMNFRNKILAKFLLTWHIGQVYESSKTPTASKATQQFFKTQLTCQLAIFQIDLVLFTNDRTLKQKFNLQIKFHRTSHRQEDISLFQTKHLFKYELWMVEVFTLSVLLMLLCQLTPRCRMIEDPDVFKSFLGNRALIIPVVMNE